MKKPVVIHIAEDKSKGPHEMKSWKVNWRLILHALSRKNIFMFNKIIAPRLSLHVSEVMSLSGLSLNCSLISQAPGHCKPIKSNDSLICALWLYTLTYGFIFVILTFLLLFFLWRGTSGFCHLSRKTNLWSLAGVRRCCCFLCPQFISTYGFQICVQFILSISQTVPS